MPNYWRIIGGADNGGILVREGKALSSAALKERLSTGAVVVEAELTGDRLRFRRTTGTGPAEGWISTRVTGKVLAEGPFKEPPAEKAVSPAVAGAEDTATAAADPSALAPMADPGARAGAAQPNGCDAKQPRWIQESRRKMEAYRTGAKMPAPDLDLEKWPERLRGKHPRFEMLPPFKRLSPKQLAEMTPQNLPGHLTGMKFPHNSEQLRTFGADWYTKAFHHFGSLPKDNRVTRVVKVEQLPHSGFDAAGGAGHKAFITVEYEKPDPNLHTELFAKFPWDYFESETGKAYRLQMSSTAGDVDAPELLTYVCCEHLFPFRIPQLYFCDINRDTTNYMLITERIPFGRRGRIENCKIVEKIERKPFEILPVCGKYQDYLLDDPARIYYCIFREMAHLAAWDQQGRYDYYFGGPCLKYTQLEFLANSGGGKAVKARMKDIKTSAAKLLVEQAENFALKVAPQVFTPKGRDPKMIEQMKKDIMELAPYFDDVNVFTGADSRYLAAMHTNLQADNAYFWNDGEGNLDAGLFDWCAFDRSVFIANFMGCLAGADVNILDEHEEGLMKIFCDEYERYGGPHLELKDVLLRYRLMWPRHLMDCCQWVERDIYRECPKEEWPTVKSTADSKFVDRWNVRCRGTALITAFEFWPRRNFRKIFEDWMAGEGKPFLTQYTL